MVRTFVIVFLFYLLQSHSAFAAKTTIIADADFMEKDTPKQTLTLRGNVNVVFQQQHLLCDEAVIHEDTGMLIAKGNVVLQNARTTLRGDRIEFNYNTNTGKLFDGVVTSGQVLIQSDVIEKIGEDEYSADDAYYTACITCPPSWGFTSSNIKAEIGGYAYIRQPWLYLLEVPVLPLPYLVVPLNSKRQTGLLVPSVGTGNQGGLSFEQPFYWAIDRSHDATFTFINYEKRGQQLLGNYRYVISPESSGELNASFLKGDRAERGMDRWFVHYEHFYQLPESYSQRMEIALASDSQYPVDFPKQLFYNGEAALKNTASVTKAYENSLLSIESNYNISLLEASFDNLDSVHRMPEINYQVLDQVVSEDYNLYFNMNMQYLNVTSQGNAYRHARYSPANDSTDCSTRDPNDPKSGVCFYENSPSGTFIYGQPEGQGAASNQAYGDIIRTGQRLDVMPTIHAPFWIGSLIDVDPAFSMRYTQYSLGVDSDVSQNYDSFPSRFYTQFNVSTKSYISRIFDWSEDTKVKHSIVPEINLKYIPNVHQTKHNFFGNSRSVRYFREQQPIDDTDTDWRNGGRGVQFDNNDRVIGKQLVEFGVTNKILSRPSAKPDEESIISSPYSQNLLFRVSQVFDINEAQRGAEARPWQAIATQLHYSAGPFSQTLDTMYYPYHSRTQWSATSTYTFADNNYLSLHYTKYYEILLDPPVDENKTTEFFRLSTGLNLQYITLYAATDYFPNAEDSNSMFRRWTLLTDLVPPGACWALRVGYSRDLGSRNKFVNNVTINMEFRFSE